MHMRSPGRSARPFTALIALVTSLVGALALVPATGSVAQAAPGTEAALAAPVAPTAPGLAAEAAPAEAAPAEAARAAGPVAAAPAVPAAPRLIASPTAALTTTSAPPAGALVVAMGGSDSNPGTLQRPFRTLAKALKAVRAGGTIVMRDGIYREGASGHATGGTKYYTGIPANVTIQSYPGEIVWFDGTQRVTTWKKSSTGGYQTPWEAPDLCAGAYYSRPPADRSASGPCAYADAAAATPAAADPLMVFADGKELTQVDSLSKLSATTFFHDWKARTVHIGANPSASRIEITKYAQAMALFKADNLKISGIGIRRYASNQYDNATGAALLINAGSGVVLDKVVVRENAGAGILVWNSRKLTVRSSMVYRNGANGINIAGSAKQVAANPGTRDDLTVEYSRIDDNNRGGFGADCTFSCSSAGSKASGLVGGNIRYNSFSDNGGGRASGFWCDLDCRDVNIYGNRIQRNARHGILYEVSGSGSIFSNLVEGNGWKSTANGGGWGLMVSAEKTRIFNNTLVDNRQSAFLYDDDRSPQSSTGYDASRVGPNSAGIEFVNNVVTTSSASSGTLLRVQGGKASIPGNTGARTVVSVLDRNSFAKPAQVRFVQWREHTGGTLHNFNSVAELRSGTGVGYMAKGQLVTSGANPFVTGDGDRLTVAGAHGVVAGTDLPGSMSSLLGVSAGSGKTIGVIRVTK